MAETREAVDDVEDAIAFALAASDFKAAMFAAAVADDAYNSVAVARCSMIVAVPAADTAKPMEDDADVALARAFAIAAFFATSAAANAASASSFACATMPCARVIAFRLCAAARAAANAASVSSAAAPALTDAAVAKPCDWPLAISAC